MPRITGGSLEAHRAQVRERVFEAFAALVAERGYDAVTLADIASRAGVGRTSLYNHFADKESVVVAFATKETRRYVAELEAALLVATSSTEALRIYVRQHVALSDRFHLGLGPELYALLSRPALTTIREHVVVVERVLRRILAEGVASGELVQQDLTTSVALVHACLQGRSVPAEAGPDRDAAVTATEEFVLRAVGAATS
ncbi:TetR/AcrR family transcriptional regulator [Solicola sp. PLA-1-18]|uniref:TetR/AcrR family transcriptional regulator n=1 Tax=Solicola sp. PLA-1-18 TaxID=3380532 RepID=UPI003B7AA22E